MGVVSRHHILPLGRASHVPVFTQCTINNNMLVSQVTLFFCVHVFLCGVCGYLHQRHCALIVQPWSSSTVKMRERERESWRCCLWHFYDKLYICGWLSAHNCFCRISNRFFFPISLFRSLMLSSFFSYSHSFFFFMKLSQLLTSYWCRVAWFCVKALNSDFAGYCQQAFKSWMK